MHDWYDERYDERYDPHPDRPIALAERVTHLIYVGGRLVETRHEHARGTVWAPYVERPAPPPAPPEPPHHLRVLAWLADLCGGSAARDALEATPLSAASLRTDVEAPDPATETQAAAVADELDAVADRLFDQETSLAFRAALIALVADDPLTVRRAVAPAHLAGGICWAVGKANGLFHPVGTHRVGVVQAHLGLSGGLAGKGNGVAAALRGFRAWRTERGRPFGVPDLMALGRTDVLLGSTREQLVRLRSLAQEAAATP